MNTPNNMHRADNPVGRFMVAVGAVIEHTRTGKILIVRRTDDQDWHPGEWEINYGRIAQFELPEEGLRREIAEETGLTSITIRQVFSAWHLFRSSEQTAENELIGITYWCTTEETTVKLSSEHSDYKWATLDEAKDIITVDGVLADLERFATISK